MTVRENLVVRCVGLFIFLAPNAGTRFLADITVRVNEKLKEGHS